jgi:hypothetical protein
MNVEIGAEAAQFPEKEYINGIAVAVYEEFVLRKLPLFKLHAGAITLGYPCRLPITDLTLLLCFSSYRKEIKSRIACLQDSTHRTEGNLDNGHA